MDTSVVDMKELSAVDRSSNFLMPIALLASTRKAVPFPLTSVKRHLWRYGYRQFSLVHEQISLRASLSSKDVEMPPKRMDSMFKNNRPLLSAFVHVVEISLYNISKTSNCPSTRMNPVLCQSSLAKVSSKYLSVCGERFDGSRKIRSCLVICRPSSFLQIENAL